MKPPQAVAVVFKGEGREVGVGGRLRELMGMVKQAILGASMLNCSQKQLNLGRLSECVKGICLRATPPILFSLVAMFMTSNIV